MIGRNSMLRAPAVARKTPYHFLPHRVGMCSARTAGATELLAETTTVEAVVAVVAAVSADANPIKNLLHKEIFDFL